MRITNTMKHVKAMLQENTGTHFLDSGGAYGRHWQRNQNRAFYNEPEYTVKFDQYGITYTKNIFWFLVNNLDYDTQLNREFTRYSTLNDNKTPSGYVLDSWFTILEHWIDHKIKTGFIKSTGFYGDGGKPKKAGDIFCHYTYNEENCLSQDYQYYLFQDDYNTEYIALMIHNGCDARGGFTKPVIFEVREDSFYMTNDCTIGCVNGHYWDSDNGGYSYTQTETDIDNLADCTLIDIEDLKDNEEYKDLLTKQIIIDPNQLTLIEDYHPAVINPVYPLVLDNTPVIVFDDNGCGYCPVCGAVLQ